MKLFSLLKPSLVTGLLISIAPEWGRAAIAYPDPPGGWTYIFHGEAATDGGAGSGFTSLDGTWSHDNGSDEWDGSAIGGEFGDTNRPGGVSVITEGNLTYLRIQDTGDPRDYGYSDPGSNRKVYFGHSLTERGAADTVMDDGVTLVFRARIPTSGPLDPLHRDGQQANDVQPYPAGGDGYVTSDGGKGNFVIKQNSGGAIAFSLTQTNDTPGGNPAQNVANFAGLTMNEFNGNRVSGNVNFGQGSATNVVPFNPTEWHEFWIVLRKDPGGVGTHQAIIYRDGSLTPSVFKMTAGNGDDYSGSSYLAIGMTATPQNSALDIDFVGYKLAAEFPPGAFDNLPPEIVNVVPAAAAGFHRAADGVSFSVSTTGTNTIPTSGVRLILNGVDLSAGLTVSGPATNRSVRSQGLTDNRVYRGEIIAADQAGRASTNKLAFDTFVAESVTVVEAEDYNHGSGQFIDNPPPAGYDTLTGTPEVDYADSATASAAVYRTLDTVGLQASTDVARARFTDAGATDYQVFQIVANDWLNYSRTFSNASYQVYLRVSSTATQAIALDRVTGDRSQPNQQTTRAGLFLAPRTGAATANQFVLLTDGTGQPATLSLAGVQTFRLTALQANNDLRWNYLVFVPAPAVAPLAPQIGNVSVSGGQFSFSFPTTSGSTYTVEFKNSLADASWTTLRTVSGTGAAAVVTEPVSAVNHRFYRVRSP